MSGIEPVAALMRATPSGETSLAGAPMGASSVAKSFATQLMDRVQEANAKIVNADALVTQFAIDDSVPVHEVTIALEQSRLSMELMMQVRARLVDAYQEFMRMQL